MTMLDISLAALTDVSMTPLTDALPLNTHLRELQCTRVGMSDAFAHERFLPAIRANTSLRLLNTSAARLPPHLPLRAILLQAEAEVAARTPAAAVAA